MKCCDFFKTINLKSLKSDLTHLQIERVDPLTLPTASKMIKQTELGFCTCELCCLFIRFGRRAQITATKKKLEKYIYLDYVITISFVLQL